MGPVALRDDEPQSPNANQVATTSGTTSSLTSPAGTSSVSSTGTTSLDTSLTMYLQEKRYPHADSLPKAKRQRGDKLTIIPGMPITTGATNTGTSDSDDDDVADDVAQQEEDENDTPSFHSDTSTICIDRFVIAEFKGKNRVVPFLVKVQEIDAVEGEVKVQVFKPTNATNTQFAISHEEPSWVKPKTIQMRDLPTYVHARQRHHVFSAPVPI